MLRFLRSIWRYLIGARWQVCAPRRSSILIFDGMNQHLLAPMLEPWSPEVLYLRGEVFNIYCLVRSFLRAGGLRDAYIDSFIEAVRPRLIVTFIDNDTRFHQLSVRHPTIKTMFIQNGWRSYYGDVFEALEHLNSEEQKSAHVDYMLVSGRYIGEEYARFIKGQIIPFGSFKSNSIQQCGTRHPELLAFISQYYEGGIVLDGKPMSHDEFFKKPDTLVLGGLLTYARVNARRLVVIPRYRRTQKAERVREEAYYRELLGAEVDFLEPDTDNPSYTAVDMSGVTVAIDSTLGYESLARGNRTAMFSVRGAICSLKGYSFGWPLKVDETGFFWTNRADSADFSQILDRLYSSTDADWQKELNLCGISDLMYSDQGNSILHRILLEVLGPPA